jgi:hypothetical protein
MLDASNVSIKAFAYWQHLCCRERGELPKECSEEFEDQYWCFSRVSLASMLAWN